LDQYQGQRFARRAALALSDTSPGPIHERQVILAIERYSRNLLWVSFDLTDLKKYFSTYLDLRITRLKFRAQNTDGR
jgi:hypothetical protein